MTSPWCFLLRFSACLPNNRKLRLTRLSSILTVRCHSRHDRNRQQKSWTQSRCQRTRLKGGWWGEIRFKRRGWAWQLVYTNGCANIYSKNNSREENYSKSHKTYQMTQKHQPPPSTIKYHNLFVTSATCDAAKSLVTLSWETHSSSTLHRSRHLALRSTKTDFCRSPPQNTSESIIFHIDAFRWRRQLR